MSTEAGNRPREAGADNIRAARDNPGVVARPPLIYLCSILIGLALQFVWPLKVLPAALEATLGGSLMLVAIVLFILSVRQFLAIGTAIQTHRPTTTILRTGPYRFSRNPIYLSFTLLYIGIGVWVNSAWLLAMVISTLVVISYGVITREERYLAHKFGDEYLRYKVSVRRWL
jgi:protein-S-isoprenylcysteine O-methyltransferase Ste14